MKPPTRTNAVLAVLLMGIIALFGKALLEIHRKVATRRLEAELESVIIPRFELHDATLAEAQEYLQNEAEKAGLGPGIRFKTLSKSESQKFFRRQINVSAGARPTENLSPAPRSLNSPAKITVNLENIPVNEAFKYVAGLAEVKMRQRLTHDSVLFFLDVPEDGTVDPVLGARFQIHADLFIDAPKLPNGNLDARFSLEKLGVKFYEGTSAEFDSAAEVLTVVNTQEQLDIISTLDSESWRIPTMLERVNDWIESQLSVFSPTPNSTLPSSSLPADPPQEKTDDKTTSPRVAVPGL